MPADRLTIGEMSRRTLLSARALRHYDAIGLLQPAAVDDRTGYRFYESKQIEVAALIRRLRDFGVPLDDVRAVVVDGGALEAVLVARRDDLGRQMASDLQALAAIDRWVNQGEKMPYSVTIKSVPPESVATFRWRGPAIETNQWAEWMQLTTSVAGAGGHMVGTIGIANVFELDGIADFEFGFVTDELLPPGDGYISRVLDGGEFASITYDLWADKPAAYQELDRWMREQRREPRGPTRERGPLVVGMGPAVDGARFVAPDPAGWQVEALLPI